MNLSVIGAGHVGLVTGACFADLGHSVLMVDHDARRIATLKRGALPFYEPGLAELIDRGVRERRLSFTTSIQQGLDRSTVIFLAVGTPSGANGEADLAAVEAVAREIARHLTGYRLIVEKSTVPVQTGVWITKTIHAVLKRHLTFDVASNPEFLREGSAIQDFLHPDRIVLGVESRRAKELLVSLYKPLNAPMITTDLQSAELIKHASNSFLALKISFINAVAQICDRVGADVVKVADGMGMDKRIGRAFLDAGAGYGGSCFPKDVAAFIHVAERIGYDFQILKAVTQINAEQRRAVVRKAGSALSTLRRKTIGVLGLSYKPDTDDLREAPSVEIITLLQEEGARVKVFDPQAMAQADGRFTGVAFCKDAYDVAKGADGLVLVTEWNEFKDLDFARIKRLMRRPVLIDGRNLYDPERMRRLGFHYVGMGRAVG